MKCKIVIGIILIAQWLFCVCAYRKFIDIDPQIDIVDSAYKRIIGGSESAFGQFPHTVSLRNSRTLSHFCGGFIVTENWIGTAAHCTKGKQPANVVGVVGEISRSTVDNTILLNKFVIHPEYSAPSLKNDIALIKTGTTIKFSTHVKPVRLFANYVAEDIDAVVTGFGYTSYPGKASDVLKHTRVRTISNEKCRSMMSKSNAAKVFESSICALPFKEGEETGACLGDSGSALVDPTGLLLGITSWGVPCALGYPDVYTRIDYYHDWIDSVID